MLQQTQVAHVIQFYKSWLKVFPNWKSLATASNAQALRAWNGLGYNRRALMLRDIARTVVKRGVPESEEEWRTLKGIGDYTAAALTMFSLHQKATPVDTNIRRVIGRVYRGIPYAQMIDEKKTKKIFARELLAVPAFYDVPQALFDFANVHCTKVPDCAHCPMKDLCKAGPKFLKGNVPVPKAMTPVAKERIQKGKKYPDRIYRGRILKLVQEVKTIPLARIGRMIDETHVANELPWIEAMVLRLEKDGMISKKGSRISISEK